MSGFGKFTKSGNNSDMDSLLVVHNEPMTDSSGPTSSSFLDRFAIFGESEPLPTDKNIPRRRNKAEQLWAVTMTISVLVLFILLLYFIEVCRQKSDPIVVPGVPEQKCKRSWLLAPGENKCIKLFNKPMKSFDKAEEYCQQQNPLGHLASVKNAEENNFLYEEAIAMQRYVREVAIGGHNMRPLENGTDFWIWPDGSDLKSYSNWASGEPNNYNHHPLGCPAQQEACIMMTLHDDRAGQWNDECCERRNIQVTLFFCEFVI